MSFIVVNHKEVKNDVFEAKNWYKKTTKCQKKTKTTFLH
jgi:hypothetical protein